MRDFIVIIKQYIFPYKSYVFKGVGANFFSAILNLLAFSLIIPILKILFKMEDTVVQFIPWDSLSFDSIGSIKSLYEVVMNNFVFYVQDLLRSYGPSTSLMILCIYLVVMTLIKVGVTYYGIYSMIPIQTGVVYDIRNKLNNKILTLPLSFSSEERKGDILARISGDVNEVEYSIVSALESLIKNPILILIYLLALMIISWQLTLFVLLVLPIAGYIMGSIGKRLKRSSFESQNRWGQLMSMVEETLTGLRIIKAFNANEFISDRFQNNNYQFKRTVHRVYARQQLAHPVSEFLGTVTISLILWYGGNIIFQGSSMISAPAFVYYLIIFYSIINPAKDLSRSTYNIQKGLASMKRINLILDYQSETNNPKVEGAVKFDQSIDYNHVTFGYNNTEVLNNFSLHIPKGKMIALVGASGSGKSTIVDLLPRFYDVQNGSITIDGIDVKDYDLGELRKMFGYVSQTPILFNDSIRNNIAFGLPNATMDEVIKAAKIGNAHDFIMDIPQGYDYNIGDGGSKLSGGQRQRLSIARAVLKNPEILVLDEATSALDNNSEQIVQEAINRLLSGRTTIVIAHRLSTVMHADQICLIENGRIVEQGTHLELIAKGGSYAKLYDIQFS